MSEEREPYLTQHQAEIALLCSELKEITTYHPVVIQSYEQRLAELETERRELLYQLDHAQSQYRSACRRIAQLNEAAWALLRSLAEPNPIPAGAQGDDIMALRRLANLIDFPGWYSL